MCICTYISMQEITPLTTVRVLLGDVSGQIGLWSNRSVVKQISGQTDQWSNRSVVKQISGQTDQWSNGCYTNGHPPVRVLHGDVSGQIGLWSNRSMVKRMLPT